MANTFGTLYRLSTFGESHSKAIGGIIDGCPAGIEIDEGFIQERLDRRKPGTTKHSSPRKEKDKVQFLSGIVDGKSLGTPIGFIIPNVDAKSADYSHLKEVYRPSHGDYTYQQKYGIRDYRGGGRASARETANWVVGGAIAGLALKKYGVKINAFVSQIGKVKLEKSDSSLDLNEIDNNEVRCPDKDTAARMISTLSSAHKKGDTLGGIVEVMIKNVPIGLGEPVFDKLHASLGKALLGINAVKGVEFGSGFKGVEMLGSEHNDAWVNRDGTLATVTNNSGGIQAGISNGMDIRFRVAFKPIATVMQENVGMNSRGEEVKIPAKGRHDVCPVPRAVPIVEALSMMVVLDFVLLSRAYL